MSASVGSICCVANLEHPFHDLSHGCQWVELTPLYLVEEASKLGIVGHCALEMSLRPTGCDREHFTGEILAPALLELPIRLFFFQAEDGIRALYVTGVQTCALPILPASREPWCRRGPSRFTGT